MTRRNLSAGDTIDAHCTRCRKTMNHTIVAMVEERPARVECNTCGGIHNYREDKEKKVTKAAAAKSKTPKNATTARKSRKDPAAADRAEWSALMLDCDPKGAAPYTMDGSFREKDLVKHPVFGIGIVRRLAPPQKVEVLFEDGARLLRCT